MLLYLMTMKPNHKAMMRALSRGRLPTEADLSAEETIERGATVQVTSGGRATPPSGPVMGARYRVDQIRYAGRVAEVHLTLLTSREAGKRIVCTAQGLTQWSRTALLVLGTDAGDIQFQIARV